MVKKAKPKKYSMSGGFTLIVLAGAIAVTGLVASMAVRRHIAVIKAEEEEELLFRGNQIKTAIDSYFLSVGSYPEKLESLLYDNKLIAPRKHLRRLYKDPVTDGSWDVIMNADGKIFGIRSKSDKEPLKKRNFPDEYKSFEGKTKYAEWEFVSRLINATPQTR
ncbi:type II secretion system protein [bacterium]|nr:MAG: type II secretion system protein [bacterium]